MTPYLKKDIAQKVTQALQTCFPDLDDAGSYAEIALPKHVSMGDYATNCALKLAKVLGQAPIAIAETLAKELQNDESFAQVSAAAPGFVNMQLTDTFLAERLENAETAAAVSLGENRKVLVEYCSLNVAKPMNIGHIRNTIFGECTKRLFIEAGYDVVTDNHIGDWGTQFAKLILAIDLYGDKDKIIQDPIPEFNALYIKFHEMAEKDPALEDQARAIFQQHEDGDEEIHAKWQWIVDVNKTYIHKTLTDLGVHFDHEIGESFYIDRSRKMLDLAIEQGVAIRNSDGSLAVDFERFDIDLPSCLLQKKDGSTLYLTRDLATIEYRMEMWQPEKIVYVVADEQSLHFKQLFALARLMKLVPDTTELIHMNYGLFRLKEGKMSTRKGRIVTAEQLLEEALERAGNILKEKGVYDLPDIDTEKLQRDIAYGAVFYSDLSQNRSTPQLFDWDKILAFEGNSAPYLQYVHARTASVLRKADEAGYIVHTELTLPEQCLPEEHQLLLLLSQWGDVIASCLVDLRQNYLAEYLYNLAVAFNAFYAAARVLDAETDAQRSFRLGLVMRTKSAIAEGLHLMNIGAPERM